MNRTPLTLAALVVSAWAAPCEASTVTLSLSNVQAHLLTQLPGQDVVLTRSGGPPAASSRLSGDAPNLSFLSTAQANSSGVLQTSVSGMWANGVQGQGSLTAYAYGGTKFTATEPNSTVFFQYLLSGAFLQVNGDNGGTSGPAVNPIGNATANTVGAEFHYSISVGAAGLVQTVVDAGAKVFGHGRYVVGNAPNAVIIPRKYELELKGGATGTMQDMGCFDEDCWGKDVFIDAISGIGVFYPEPGIEYSIDVTLRTTIAMKPFENEAQAVSNDPNGLNFLSITMTTPNGAPSTVPTPGSASLMLAGFSAWMLARRRKAPSGAGSLTTGA